ncbi:MAG: flippase-like domain-containing protein [Cyanobacteria bacterium]|nr:flippase-like domain-containing protein [Cyanobacteriota bacterium]
MSQTANNSWKTVLKVVLSLTVLAWIFHQAGLEKTLQSLKEANLWYVPVGVLIYLSSQVVSSYRWQFLSHALGFRLGLRTMYEFYLIGMFFNLCIPGAIGGDVIRMVYLAKECGRKKREAFLTILAERGVGLAALLILTCIICFTAAANPLPITARASVIVLTAGLLLGTLSLRWLPIDRWEVKFPKLALINQARVFWTDSDLLLRSIGISFCNHVVMIILHMLIAKAMGIQVPLLYMVCVYGIVSLVSVLPIFFGGLGLREGAYQLLLAKIGIAPHVGLAFGLYWFLIILITSGVGGLVLIKGHYKTPTASDSDWEETLEAS